MEETLMGMMITTTTTIIKNWRGHVSSNEMLDRCLLFFFPKCFVAVDNTSCFAYRDYILLPVCWSRFSWLWNRDSEGLWEPSFSSLRAVLTRIMWFIEQWCPSRWIQYWLNCFFDWIVPRFVATSMILLVDNLLSEHRFLPDLYILMIQIHCLSFWWW
jgi:hypothetical protein